MGSFLRARSFVLAIFVLALCLVLNTHSVFADSLSGLEWVKSEFNPVIELGPSGSWDEGRLDFLVAYKAMEDYKIWYMGMHNFYTSGKQVIGYASSDEGTHWNKYLYNPVLTSNYEWESSMVYAGSVTFDGVYRLWYSGYPGSVDTAIGYATSTDGIHWDKYTSNPVLTRTASGWNDRYVDDPSVIYENGIYKMWFQGVSTVGGNPHPQGIGYATSSDGIHWAEYEHNPVFPRIELEVRPNVLKDGGIYYMFFRCDPHLGEGNGICYATSPDGISWTVSSDGPLIALGGLGSWDNVKLDNPYVIKDGDTFKMWYAGFDSLGHGRIGYAYTRPKTPACPQGPELGLLSSLNNYPYDFYDQYYNYDDNAVKPDTIKKCPTDIDSEDIWMVHAINGTYATYPMKAAFSGSVIGIDFNTWYDWSTAVKTPTNEPGKVFSIKYPEFEFDISGQVSKMPVVKNDREKSDLVKSIIDAGEFSVTLDGMYAKAPIEKTSGTRAEIPIYAGWRMVSPGVQRDLQCSGNFNVFYDSLTGEFGDNAPEQVNCRTGTYLELKDATYGEKISVDAGLFRFGGRVSIGLNLSPYIDTSGSIRTQPPYAITTGSGINLSVSGSVNAKGELCTILTACKQVDKTAAIPKIANVTTFVEAVTAFQNLTGNEGIISMTPRLSDGKTVEYRGLKALSPVFREEGSNILVSADICLNLSDIDVPCGGIIDCQQCLFKGKIIDIKPWEIYTGETRIIIHSPVELTIYDEFGNKAGFNSEGEFETEIPGATYAEEDGEKILSFPTSTGRFLVVLNGTGVGTYGMDIIRPILLQLLDGTIVIQEATYNISGMNTETGREDYYYFDFAAIERLINEKIAGKADVDRAINDSFSELVINRTDAQKLPAIISLGNFYAAKGGTVNLNASLMSLSSPVPGKELNFYLDGFPIGHNTTDSDGTANLAYIISSDSANGSHGLNASFEGDNDYYSYYSLSTLDVSNPPLMVSLDVPLYVSGIVHIKGNVQGRAPEQTILINDSAVISGSDYDWDSRGQVDGLHAVEFKAKTPDGEEASAIKIVFVDNNPPEIQVSGASDSGCYGMSIAPTVNIADAWLDTYRLTLDGSPFVNGSQISAEGKHTLEVNALDKLGHSSYKKVDFYIGKFKIADVSRSGNDFKTGSLVVFFVTFEGGINSCFSDSRLDVYVNEALYSQVSPQVCNTQGLKTKCLYKFRADKAGKYSIDVEANGEVIGTRVEEFIVSSKKK